MVKSIKSVSCVCIENPYLEYLNSNIRNFDLYRVCLNLRKKNEDLKGNTGTAASNDVFFKVAKLHFGESKIIIDLGLGVFKTASNGLFVFGSSFKQFAIALEKGPEPLLITYLISSLFE